MPEQVVSTIFKVIDSATKPLRAIGAAAGRVSGAFDRATSRMAQMAGIAGGIGIGLTFRNAVKDVEELVDVTRRLMVVTKEGPEITSAWVDYFGDVGIGAAALERTLGYINKQQEAFKLGSKNVGKQFKALGLDINKGPLDAMQRMAEQAQAGTLNIGAMAMTFRMMPQEAARVVEYLKEGPPIAQGIQERVKQGLDTVNGIVVAQAKAYEKARFGLKDIWGTMKLVLGKELLPAVIDIAQRLRKGFEDALPTVQKIGKFLRDHMTVIIGLVKTMGKLMLANFAVMKATSLLGMAGGKGFGIGGAVGKIGGLVLGGVGPAMGLGKILFSVLGRATLIGTAIWAAVKGVQYLINNWDKVKQVVGKIATELKPVIDPIRRLFGMIKTLFAEYIPAVFGKLVTWLRKIGFLAPPDKKPKITEIRTPNVQKIEELTSRFITAKQLPGFAMSGQMYESRETFQKMNKLWLRTMVPAERKALREKEKLENLAKTAGLAGAPVFDFRGSRFDIKQDFAEGMDPDRIAAAFATDLAKLGEKRLQSGFSPLFSVT